MEPKRRYQVLHVGTGQWIDCHYEHLVPVHVQEAAVGNFQQGMLVRTHDESFWGKVVRVFHPEHGVEMVVVCWLKKIDHFEFLLE